VSTTVRVANYYPGLLGGFWDIGADTPTDELGLSTDALLFLTQFGQEITYYPRSGGSRVILGIIDWSPPAPVDGAPAGMGKIITVSVANSGTSVDDDDVGGILASAIDTGGDKLELPLREGATATQRRITKMPVQDAGMLKFTIT